jgi:hypothetical protein
VLCGLLAAVGALASGQASATGARLSPPVLSCGDTAQASLKVKVCGGPTGAPAGFVLNWLEADPDQPWPSTDACYAYFYNKYRGHRLKAGGCIDVSVGELLAYEASKTTCAKALTCGTTYGFKVFARATSTGTRSKLSYPLHCSTDPCTPAKTCTLTQGFWKTHGPTPAGNNGNEWPVANLQLGNITYTDLQLLSVLKKAPAGNGLIALAHQLIAAKLNVADGVDPAAVSAAIVAADALIGPLVVPPVGGGSLAPSATGALIDTLASYNEGGVGPGHCPG